MNEQLNKIEQVFLGFINEHEAANGDSITTLEELKQEENYKDFLGLLIRVHNAAIEAAAESATMCDKWEVDKQSILNLKIQ